MADLHVGGLAVCIDHASKLHEFHVRCVHHSKPGVYGRAMAVRERGGKKSDGRRYMFGLRPPMADVAVSAYRTCQFPSWGDGEAPTHIYCGAPSVLGTSWCAKHLALVAAPSSTAHARLVDAQRHHPGMERALDQRTKRYRRTGR